MQPAWDALLELRLEDEVQMNSAEAMFERLIARPLQAVPPPPHPVAILIDGLDAMSHKVWDGQYARGSAAPDSATLPPHSRADRDAPAGTGCCGQAQNQFARLVAQSLRPDGFTLPPWMRVVIFSRCVYCPLPRPPAAVVVDVVSLRNCLLQELRPCIERGARNRPCRGSGPDAERRRPQQ